MAIWDNLFNRKDIEKAAPLLPPGAQVTEINQAELLQLQQGYGSGAMQALDRQAWLASVPFGPSRPLTPAAINPLNEDGRPDPRRWQYPVAWNININDNRLVPWTMLRTAADNIDILRRCIEVLKARLMGMDWDITFSDSASEMIVHESGGDHIRAMQKARDKFTPDIARMREFWQTPDRINGYGFKEWLNVVLEEILVLDALAIYPHPDLGGNLHSLEILDGSTIKPLLDDRGMRPQSPFPAYQQILYGFPRSEFIATSDDAKYDGEYSADELIYKVRNPRTWTPYGYSPVERSLSVADIYLRRQQWLRSEFTDGVMPDLMFKTDENFGNTPELVRAYEAILNDDLAGQTAERKRARVLPAGLDPVDMSAHSEKYSATLDEYLVKAICGHFGVGPSEIGYADGGALGGTGQQVGEAASGEVIGVEPIMLWLSDLISDISYKFLGMPRELVFQFNGGRETDDQAMASRRDIEVKGGQRSLNEARSELNLPLIDSPAADAPMLFTGQGLYMFGEEGLIPVAPPAPPAPAMPEGGPVEAVVGEPAPEDKPKDKPEATSPVDQTSEVKAFLKWAKKGNTERDFEFFALDPVHASALNTAAKSDFELVKMIADGLLPKA